MDEEKVRAYINKKVLLVLKNGFKFTTIIPDFKGKSFNAKDKFGENITIECDMISLIVEKEVGIND